MYLWPVFLFPFKCFLSFQHANFISKLKTANRLHLEKYDSITEWLTNQLAIKYEHIIKCWYKGYTTHFSKLLPCLFTQTVRLILSYIHIYQSSHGHKSVWLKDLWQGHAEKSDCYLTCFTAGGGDRPISNTGAMHLPACACVRECVKGSHWSKDRARTWMIEVTWVTS